MRKRNLFRRCALLAVFAASISVVGPAQAKNDFDALLADINFGAAAAEFDDVAPPSASDTIAEASELASAQADALLDPLAVVPAAVPAEAPMAMPAAPTAAETLPAPPMPALIPVDVAAVADCGGQCGDACSGQCGNRCGHHGHKLIQEGYCQPYIPPQLPTSTFYQYWRSNACNTQVWDGFRNRCHPKIDLSIHHKSNCGCGNGCDQGCSLAPVDCGPAPTEWCGKQACDSVACDAR